MRPADREPFGARSRGNRSPAVRRSVVRCAEELFDLLEIALANGVFRDIVHKRDVFRNLDARKLGLDGLDDLVARDLGIRPEYDPFMTMAFLSLPVIPDLKLTDAGLVDVAAGKIVSVSVL